MSKPKKVEQTDDKIKVDGSFLRKVLKVVDDLSKTVSSWVDWKISITKQVEFHQKNIDTIQDLIKKQNELSIQPIFQSNQKGPIVDEKFHPKVISIDSLGETRNNIEVYFSSQSVPSHMISQKGKEFEDEMFMIIKKYDIKALKIDYKV